MQCWARLRGICAQNGLLVEFILKSLKIRYISGDKRLIYFFTIFEEVLGDL